MILPRGQLVLVVGPSGAGKDTLIDHARGRLQSELGFRFVRRVITRPASVGEDHQPADAEMFEQLAANNVFALHWHAHGFSYGLPPIINEWMAKGCTVIANGSRAVLQEARSRFPNLHVVNITAPPEIIAARLQARGRESGTMISDRLARAESVDIAESATHEIDNSGSLEAGGEALIRALLAIRGARAPTT